MGGVGTKDSIAAARSIIDLVFGRKLELSILAPAAPSADQLGPQRAQVSFEKWLEQQPETRIIELESADVTDALTAS